ncbi:MAG: hypothetical protein JSU95_08235 [Betaproteobacteria bacterium]|nr:MAG: hypothetical protein JSU95_08235 [Betaproteobacteria bacterium]
MRRVREQRAGKGFRVIRPAKSQTVFGEAFALSGPAIVEIVTDVELV